MATSIVIVNYNTSSQIIECINTLQDEDVDQIVVVDNASPNDTPDNILKFHPHVNLLKIKDNVGFGGGCNTGFDWVNENTRSEFILFLNPDTKVEAGLIKTLESKFSNQSIGAVTPLITLAEDQNILWYGGGEISWFKGSANVPECGKNYENTIALKERYITFATGCALMIRRELFERIGGFDARYFMYEEDAEISLSIVNQGYKILYCPNAVVRHIGQASQGEEQKDFWMYDPRNPKLPFFVYYTTRNRFFTVLKHGNLFQRLCFYIGFPGWVIRRGLPWLIHQRYDAFKALAKGFVDSMNFKNKMEARK